MNLESGKNYKFNLSMYVGEERAQYSIKLQKLLFSLGYKWMGGIDKVGQTNERFIYTNRFDIIFGNRYDAFEEDESLEISLNELFPEIDPHITVTKIRIVKATTGCWYYECIYFEFNVVSVIEQDDVLVYVVKVGNGTKTVDALDCVVCDVRPSTTSEICTKKNIEVGSHVICKLYPDKIYNVIAIGNAVLLRAIQCVGDMHDEIVIGRQIVIDTVELAVTDVYRPFKNREEYKPYRDKWIIGKNNMVCRIDAYDEHTVVLGGKRVSWEEAFKTATFDDGTPFGVKV